MEGRKERRRSDAQYNPDQRVVGSRVYWECGMYASLYGSKVYRCSARGRKRSG